jgi:hypothetical protein
MKDFFVNKFHTGKFKQLGSGNILFLVFILPILMLVGSIVIDIQSYTERQVLLQTLADDATLFSVKYLPNSNLATTALTNFIATKSSSNIDKLDIQKDYVAVVLKDNFIPTLASFFVPDVQNPAPFLNVPLVAVSSSRLTPTDLFIAFDRGLGTAPSLTASIFDRFGNPNEFPLPYQFSQNQFFYGGNQIVPEIALEQCFNPRILPLKQMASRAIDLVRGISTTRIAVSFFPGSINFVGNNSRLDDSAKGKSVELLDSYLESNNDELLWITENENDQAFPVKSSHCYSVLKDSTSDDNYHFPFPTVYDQNNLNLNLSEVVWSRVASHTAKFDTSVALRSVINQLLSSSSDSTRGNLVNSAIQVGLFFTFGDIQANGTSLQVSGDNAWSKIAESLELIKQNKLQFKNKMKLYFFVYQGNTAQLALLQSLFDQYKIIDSGREILSVSVIAADSLSKILDETIPFVVRGAQNAVLKQ